MILDAFVKQNKADCPGQKILLFWREYIQYPVEVFIRVILYHDPAALLAVE